MSLHKATSGGRQSEDVAFFFYFQTNTFQLVVVTMESSSCAILLYPKDGLQFFSTSIRGEPKTLETGFNEGLVQGWWWNTQQGAYFRITTDEEASIRDLTEYESLVDIIYKIYFYKS